MGEELLVNFRGQVQGVGFRWTVAESAEQFGLVGTVKNLSDGSVEACVQGTKEDLEKFLLSIKSNPGFARIQSVSCEYRELSHPCSSFEIVV